MRPDDTLFDVEPDLPEERPDDEADLGDLLEGRVPPELIASAFTSGELTSLLDELAPAFESSDPLGPELAASAMLGLLRQLAPADYERVVELGPMAAGRANPDRRQLAMLRALQGVAESAQLRGLAERHATEIVALGVEDPPWAAMLGQGEVGAGLLYRDVYGDMGTLLVTYRYGANEHGLVALVDFNHAGGWVKDLYPVDDPGRVLRELRRDQKMRGGMTVVEPLDPVRAHQLLYDGVQVADMTLGNQPTEEYLQARAFALARCRAVGIESSVLDETEEIDADPYEETRRVVGEFLASPEAQALQSGPGVERAAELVVDFSIEYDDHRTYRVSPVKTSTFLLDFVPRKVILDKPTRSALPDVVRAWTRYAAGKQGLPAPALAELSAAVDEFIGEFEATQPVDAQSRFAGVALPPELAKVVADLGGHPQHESRKVNRATAKRRRPQSFDLTAAYELSITMTGTEPPVWRRLRVPGFVRLARLHGVIQFAFDWDDSHLHRFSEPGSFEELDELRQLAEVVPAVGDELVYTYDFGDDWELQIVVDQIESGAVTESRFVPSCVAGGRAAPPEDCGGVWGYAEMCEALADRDHEDHDHYFDWLGLADPADFDPERFDRGALNRLLAAVPLTSPKSGGKQRRKRRK